MNGRLYLAAAHAYLLHDLKAVLVVIAFRYLLVINDQHRGHDKQDSQEDPYEEKPSVNFQKRYSPVHLCLQFKAACGSQLLHQNLLKSFLLFPSGFQVKTVHPLDVTGKICQNTFLFPVKLIQRLPVRDNDILGRRHQCFILAVPHKSIQLLRHTVFFSENLQHRKIKCLAVRVDENLPFSQLFLLSCYSIVVIQRHEEKGIGIILHRAGTLPINGIAVALTDGLKSHIGIFPFLFQAQPALFPQPANGLRRPLRLLFLSIEIKHKVRWITVPDNVFHPRHQGCGRGDHHQHHGGQDTDICQSHRILLHPVYHA